jgi:monofunctional biosynthetic peptidoglycan transglycosylase
LLALGTVGLSAVLVLPFRWLDPPTTSFMLQSRAAGRGAERAWVPLSDISSDLAIAVVAAEDQKFPFHRGFDFASIREALDEGDRGASTISQQVAKNLYLWPGRSWLRKGLEAWLTVWIELSWPKRRIMEVYLNVAEFGSGVFGAEVAARRYFGKPAAELGRRESALLAAVLPSPRERNAAAPSVWLDERADWILAQARALGGPAYLE